MFRFTFSLFLLLFYGLSSQAQVAPDCGDAIPICNNTPVNGGTQGFGVDDFNGATASGCLERTLDGAIESNSAWYRFRTGAAGQLGFNIGIKTEEDWDFALYRTDDCSDLGEPIRCNFFDNQDADSFIGVGEDPTGAMANVQYEEWLQVEAGEDYYLFINNFSNNNSGFSIQFSGNIFVTHPYDALDCSIIDNLLGSPISACTNENIVLDATTADALDYSWSRDIGDGFETIAGEDDATLEVHDAALYRVTVARNSGNLISEVEVVFSETPVAHPASDEASCTGLEIFDFSVKDAEILQGQSPEEFLVSYHSSQDDATFGTLALPRQYRTQTGFQTIYVRVASINNPRCFDASQNFDLINVPSPQFDFEEDVFICENGTSVNLGPTNANPDYSYEWDSGQTSPNISVSEAGNHTLTITNTQGGLSCSDARTITVTVSKPPRITDIIIEDLSNNNMVTVISDSPNELEYRLDDGEYQAGNLFTQVLPGAHTVTVNDPNGCGSITENIVVVGFPKFFTPNNDGSNDVWHISGLDRLSDPSVSIFDRYGKLMVKLDGSEYNWVGTFRGRLLPESDYWFKLTYKDGDGQTVTAKYINNHFSLKR